MGDNIMYAPTLTDDPWRYLPESGRDSVDAAEADIKALPSTGNPRILLVGPAAAGKSSLINSFLSVSAGRKCQLAMSAGQMGGRNTVTVKFKHYRDRNMLKNVKITDCMGIIEDHEVKEGLQDHDFLMLLKGHIKKNYQFDVNNPIDGNSEFYREHPEYEDRVHCVVIVISAKAVDDDIPPGLVRKINRLQNAIIDADISRVLILTKVDLLCDEVRKDASKIFHSIKVQSTVQKASDIFLIDTASIYPVINFEKDISLPTKKKIPIILALRQILRNATDKFQYDIEDMD